MTTNGVLVSDQPSRPKCCRECATFFERLRESLGEIRKLPSGAEYHDGEQVIAHLNYALGEENWSYRIIERWREADSDEVCVLCEMTITFWQHDPNDEGYNKHVVTKQDFGAQQIKRNSKTKLPISIGDDYKAAATDGLKRCARLIGVALYLWAKNPQPVYRRSDTEELERADRRAVAATRATGAPGAPAALPAASETATRSEGPERTKLEDRYADLLAEATNLGFRAGFVTLEIRTLTDQQLHAFGKQLRAHVDKHAEQAVA